MDVRRKQGTKKLVQKSQALRKKLYIIVSTNDSLVQITAIFARDLDHLGKGVSQLSLSKSDLVSMAISLHNFSGKMSSQHEVPTCCSGTPLELGCLQDM